MAPRKRKLPADDRAPEREDDVLLPPSQLEDDDQESTPPEAQDPREERRALAAGVALGPDSLVGSYFHQIENGEIKWAGLVVGEVQAGYYLCEVDSGLDGAERARAQVILTLDQMVSGDDGYECRFYDSEELMRAAYAEFLTTEGGDE